jgi:phospholipase/carboxylesterase
MLNDYRLAPLNGGAAKRAVIFLHGVGDKGDGGLLSIGQMWQRALPDCAFLCPDAPFPFDMAPPDFGGRQWFSLRSFAPEAMLAGVKEAAPLLNDYIDHVLTTLNLTSDKLALVGFSQGTIMALYAGPRRKDQVACILGYSGLLAGGDTLAAEKRSSPPVLLMHGVMDEVIAFPMMEAAREGLAHAGIDVATIACHGSGHTIDERGLVEGLTFLKKHLG